MSIWQRLTSLLPFRTKTTADNPDRWFLDWAIGEQTLTGQRVSWETALQMSAVWACVRVRSEDIGKVPCILYRRASDGGKERATDHPLYGLLRNGPNPRDTAYSFKQLMQAQVDLRGNAYAIKEFDPRGQIVALWPVNPIYNVQILRAPADLLGTELFYRIGNADPVPAEAVLHLRGNSLDGITGLSPIRYHRETIGLGLAAERYGAAFFGNSAQPRGVIEVPTPIGKEAADSLRKSWEERYRGFENAHRLAIFDGGMKWVQTAIDNTDAQYIETRKLQNQEIWRIYRMPPHKVGDLDKATFSNIEQQALEYVQDCLLSEAVRWETTLWRDLLTEQEQQVYFFEFMLDVLLRGDFKSRMDGYAIGRNWGIFSANDCRDKENLNRIPNGDIYLQPLNMVEAGAPPPPPPATAPDISPAGAKELIKQLTLIAARGEARMNANGHALEHNDA